jgi:uncharacterized coiled-coil DUF342 family protein
MPYESDKNSDEMRRQIAELLEESKRIRERSEELAQRIAELRRRIERGEGSAAGKSPST